MVAIINPLPAGSAKQFLAPVLTLMAGASAVAVSLPSSAAGFTAIPLPQKKLDTVAQTASGKPETEKQPKQEQTVSKPPANEDPKAYAQCIAALKEAGVEFTENEKAIDDGNGCGIANPLTVRTVLPGIKLEPKATIRCETALQLSRWAAESIVPAAARAFGPEKTITSFHQVSSYQCRNRYGTPSGKQSEHAHGNAIDISGFTFSGKDDVTIEPRAKDSTLTGAFQRSIIASGCLYFTTVLGPESDDTHKTHIHLDVIKRKRGYRYCW